MNYILNEICKILIYKLLDKYTYPTMQDKSNKTITKIISVHLNLI